VHSHKYNLLKDTLFDSVREHIVTSKDIFVVCLCIPGVYVHVSFSSHSLCVFNSIRATTCARLPLIVVHALIGANIDIHNKD